MESAQHSDRRRLLDERAKQLAQIPEKELLNRADLRAVIPFRLADETYGIELDYLKLVHPLVDCLPLPGTPDFILGITSIEGVLYSVTDLKPLFSLPSQSITNFNKLLILEHGSSQFALLADEVMAVSEINLSQLETLENWHGADSRYLMGITPERMILLDAAALLESPDLQVTS